MDSGLRGIGGIFIACAVAIIADHLGITGWRIFAIIALIAAGVPLAITGKWKGW